MAYQTTTTNSYGSRLKNSFGGIGTGFLLLIAGIVLLFWNEGRTVKTTKMLKEVEKVCVHVDDIDSADGSLSGQLVHMNGAAATEEILSDPTFGVSTVVPAVRLSTTVEYYQWVEIVSEERKDKIGGGEEIVTTYNYEKQWVRDLVGSSEFADPSYKDANNRSPLMTPSELDKVASTVTFGAYVLPDRLKAQISGDQPFDITVDEGISALVDAEAAKMYADTAGGYFHVNGNVIYLGRSSSVPQVGDCRITYTRTLPGEVSIIAKVVGNTFESYTAANGKTFETLYNGTHSLEEMMSSEKSGNKTTAWLLRLLGLVLLYLGFKGIFGFLVTLAKVLPFLASIISLGTGLVSFVLALAIGLVVIAIAWVFYRPVLGIILLVAAIALIWYFAQKGKQKKELHS